MAFLLTFYDLLQHNYSRVPQPLTAQYAGRTLEDLEAAKEAGDKVYEDGILVTVF